MPSQKRAALRTVRRSCSARLCSAAFLLFVLAIPCCAQSDPSNLEVRLFRSVNNAQTSFKTSVINVTDYSVYPLVVALPAGLATYGYFADKDDEFGTGVLLATSEVLTYGASTLIKNIVRRERPYEALSDVTTHHLDPADPYSFPSGHSTAAFAIATLLTLRYPKPAVYIPAYAWAAIVAYGRVYFGVHYPGDVLAGAILGTAGSILVYECRNSILPTAFRVVGKGQSANVTALVVPSRGGALMSVALTF